MPVVTNTGGDLKLPMCTLKRGATLVDPGAWTKARKHPAVIAHLASGRLVMEKGAAAPKPTAKSEPAPPAPSPMETEATPPGDGPVLAAAVDADGDGHVDLSALSAKAAIELVATMSLEVVEAELINEAEGKDRKTVMSALEDRKAELTADED